MQLRLGEPPLTVARSLESNSAPLPVREADRSEITGRKGSIYYRAHSYHTKVPPEGIARLIDHYTEHSADLEAILDACAAGAPDLPTQKSTRAD